jgi:hypothetical protein
VRPFTNEQAINVLLMVADLNDPLAVALVDGEGIAVKGLPEQVGTYYETVADIYKWWIKNMDTNAIDVLNNMATNNEAMQSAVADYVKEHPEAETAAADMLARSVRL